VDTSRRQVSSQLGCDLISSWDEHIGRRLTEFLPHFERVAAVLDQEQERHFERQQEREQQEERQVENFESRVPVSPIVSEAARILSQGFQLNRLREVSDRFLLSRCLDENTSCANTNVIGLLGRHDVYVTKGFLDCVRFQGLSSSLTEDKYVKWANWVAISSSSSTDTKSKELTILSGFEVNELYGNFHRSPPGVSLRMFAPILRPIQASRLIDRDLLAVHPPRPFPLLLEPKNDDSVRAGLLAIALFNGELFFQDILQGKEEDLLNRFFVPASLVRTLMELRWKGVIGNQFIGSDTQRWIENAI
jgi:hypothetical protein